MLSQIARLVNFIYCIYIYLYIYCLNVISKVSSVNNHTWLLTMPQQHIFAFLSVINIVSVMPVQEGFLWGL